MRSVANFPPAESSAIQGIRRATAAFDAAASALNRPSGSTVEGSSTSEDRVRISAEGRAAASATPDAIVTALTEQSVAEHQFRANLKILHTSQEMDRELLRLGTEPAG